MAVHTRFLALIMVDPFDDTANGDEWNLERPGEIFSQQYFKTYADTVEM